MSQCFTSPKYWGYHVQQTLGLVMEHLPTQNGTFTNPWLWYGNQPKFARWNPPRNACSTLPLHHLGCKEYPLEKPLVICYSLLLKNDHRNSHLGDLLQFASEDDHRKSWLRWFVPVRYKMTIEIVDLGDLLQFAIENDYRKSWLRWFVAVCYWKWP